MQTINELNKKWWYRLTKVIFIFLFIVGQSLGLFFAYSYSNEVEYKITKKSLINIGKEIKNHELSDSFRADNAAPVNCKSESDKITSEDKHLTDEEKECLSRTYVTGENPEYNAYEEKRITYLNEKIRAFTEEDFFQIGKTAYDNNYSDNYTEGSSSELIAELRTSSLKALEKYEYIQKYSIMGKVIIMLITVIAIAVIFLLIQRIFYYIALGSLKPLRT